MFRGQRMTFELKNRDSRVAALTIILGVAFFLRLGYMWFADGERFRTETVYSADGTVYVELAENISSGKGFRAFGELTSQRAPVYPAMLAVADMLFMRPWFLIRIVQCILGAVLCAQLINMGILVDKPLAGNLAAVAAALSYELINLNAYIVTETLYAFLFISAILALFSYQKLPSSLRAGGSGILMGLVVLTRPVLLPFQLFMPVWFVLVARKGNPARHLLGHAAVYLVFFVMVISPWTIRNYMVHEAFIPVTSEGGKYIYASHSPGVTGGTDGGYVAGRDWNRDLSDRVQTDSEAEKSQKMARAGLKYILNHPRRTIVLFPRKFWNMWRPWRGDASWLSTFLASAMYIPVALLFLAGIYINRKEWLQYSLVYGVVAYTICLQTVMHGAVRHRYALFPLLLFCAMVTLVTMLQERRW